MSEMKDPEQALMRLLEQRTPYVVLCGPQMSGKTTLVRKLVQDGILMQKEFHGPNEYETDLYRCDDKPSGNEVQVTIIESNVPVLRVPDDQHVFFEHLAEWTAT
jgi:GTPase SAR1 family protein